MIALIKTFFSGGRLVSDVIDGLNQAHRDRLNAKNDKDRIAADVRVAQLEAQMKVLVAEQKSWTTRWIRPALMAPVVFYWGKILTYDKLGYGVTDDLTETQWYIVGVMFGFYFLTRPFGRK